MSRRQTARYCADPDAISALRRDGLGWGHDLDCGCFHDVAQTRKPGGLSRIFAALTRRT